MATFNGSNFVKDQIDSIIFQKCCQVSLFIIDDCSTDNTFNLVKSLKYKNITIIKNKKNCGFMQTFLKLIIDAKLDNYDFIALADQDDIFNENKFIKSIEELISNNAVGISSSVKCFGSSSKILNQSNKITKYDFLFEGAGQGNTFVMRKIFFKEFQCFVKKNSIILSSFYFHDWLIYLFCRSRNYNWAFYNEPLTQYRIHNDNVVGDKYSLRGIFARLNKITNGWYLDQIYKANSISRLINPNVIDFKKLSFVSLFKILLLDSRRKISDRVFLLLTFIFNK
jgi:rhamnosyltransferase